MATGLDIVLLAAAAFLILGVLLYFFALYNGLIALKNDMAKAWANIDVLLKQRNDELPKLIDTCQAYMKYEKGVLTQITELRTAMMKAGTVQEKARANDALSGALKSLFAVAENYPVLKASENFQQLQSRISGLENSLADRRELYNDSVNLYNIRIASLPDTFVANMLSYRPEQMFKVPAEQKEDVKINIKVP